MLLILMMGFTSIAQTIAVADLSTNGVEATPTIAGKLTRLEVVKLSTYTVLDEFDMNESLKNHEGFNECYGNRCLIKLGETLKVVYVLSGSISGLGNKIVINLKLLDIKAGKLHKTHALEFEDQEMELQRMIGIVLQELHGKPVDEITKKSLTYRNDFITTNNVGRINNTGPRMGFSYIHPTRQEGDLYNYMTRSEQNGGLEILPVMSHIGFQFEKAYIGTENFQALGELVINFSGMEQGQFFPSMTLMNGFRFGKAGWEFGFGPSIGIRKYAQVHRTFSDDGTRYYTQTQWENSAYEQWQNDASNFDSLGYVINYYTPPSSSEYTKMLHNDGQLKLNASFVFALGRTFRYGGLNVPVNMYYITDKFGGSVGLSMGFNIVTKKRRISKK